MPSRHSTWGRWRQVCGLWPFSSGASSPMIRVPLGRHEETQATVCCDPISWFQRARLISNPSAFILGKPGLGKSTLVRRMFLGLSAQGIHPLVLGDLKGEHVKAVKALGGQVIKLGRGVGYLNILDAGQAVEVAGLLEALKARGFVERSGMVICGGLPASEMPLLTSAIPLSRQEQQKLISWQDPPVWDSRGLDVDPPGRGKFLIKVGGRPGIPVRIGLTSIEKNDGLNDTDTRWHPPAEPPLGPVAARLPGEGGRA
ncbi:MAG: hypothetical protein ACQEXN_17795 [Actinomycetota bacterium]